jgi:hypothetical protein
MAGETAEATAEFLSRAEEAVTQEKRPAAPGNQTPYWLSGDVDKNFSHRRLGRRAPAGV